MIKATIEDTFACLLQPLSEGFEANGQVIHPVIQQVHEHLWLVNHEKKAYTIFVHGVDEKQKTVDLSINGKRATVQIRSRIDQLLKQLGMEAQMAQKLDTLKAPMPGLIHSILVQEGQTVEKGQPLLILEAMKMENILKSPGEGIIQQIHAQEKASVEKNELLISFQA